MGGIQTAGVDVSVNGFTPSLIGDIDSVVTGREASASARSIGTKAGDADSLWFLDFDSDGKIDGKGHREAGRRNGLG